MGAFAEAGFTAVPHPGEPRVPHLDRRARERAAAGGARAPASCGPPALPDRRQRRRRVLPDGPGADEQMLDLLGRQVASPVQFVRGLETLYDAGARVFVEVGPKRALQGFAEDVLGATHDDVQALFTNHPKAGDVPSFNQALCGLYAAGLGAAAPAAPAARRRACRAPRRRRSRRADRDRPGRVDPGPSWSRHDHRPLRRARPPVRRLPRARSRDHARAPRPRRPAVGSRADGAGRHHRRRARPARHRAGLRRRTTSARLLGGEQLIDLIPTPFRHAILDKHITRLVKGEGGGRFESIDDPADVIKLAGRAGHLDLVEEFGVDRRARPRARHASPGSRSAPASTRCATPASRSSCATRRTTLGTQLPDALGAARGAARRHRRHLRLGVPRARRLRRRARALLRPTSGRRHELERAASRCAPASTRRRRRSAAEVDHRIARAARRCSPRRATSSTAASCSASCRWGTRSSPSSSARAGRTPRSTPPARAPRRPSPWPRTGSAPAAAAGSSSSPADDATADHLLDWIGAGFLASGAAATDDVVEDAALPFDRRRHGMIIGHGRRGLVVETAEAARERGDPADLRGARRRSPPTAPSTAPASTSSTSARSWSSWSPRPRPRGVDRHEIAPETVFVSHETYTPARGGSAAAEINALRQRLRRRRRPDRHRQHQGLHRPPDGRGHRGRRRGQDARDRPRAAGPELPRGRPRARPAQPVEAAARTRCATRCGSAAGFGSQISMTLLRWTPVPDGRPPRARPSWATPTASSTRRPGRRGCAASAGRTHPSSRSSQRRAARAWTGAGPRRRTAPAAPGRAAWRSRPRRRSHRSCPSPPVPCPLAAGPAAPPPRRAPAAAAPAGGGPGGGRGPGDRRRRRPATRGRCWISTSIWRPTSASTRSSRPRCSPRSARRTAIQRDDTLQLRDYPTLTHVIGFVRDRGTNLPAAAPPPRRAPRRGRAGRRRRRRGWTRCVAEVLALVAEKTGYPQEMLDLDLDLEADLGVDTVKQAEVFAAIRETYGIPRDDSCSCGTTRR